MPKVRKRAPSTRPARRGESDRVSIEVVPVPSSANISSFAGLEKIRHDNVASFKPSRSACDQAAERLAQRGFRIIAISPYSISVEAAPELFTRTFGTDLKLWRPKMLDTGDLAARSFLAPAEGATWECPPDLIDVVEHAYIQPPPIYFESAVPPRVPYYHLTVPADVAALTGASTAHRQGITGRGVKVVMVDTGLYMHAFYRQHRYSVSVTPAPDASGPSRDENGHGTAEAANVLAIAPDAALVMVKQGRNATAAFKKAIELEPAIISCSWGYDLVDTASPQRRHLASVPNTFRALELEVARAVAKGITVIFSAGNGHVSFPGMHPDVISAGGVFVDQDETLRASDYASAFDSRPYPGRHVPDVCGLVGLQPSAVYIMLPAQPGCEIDRQMAAAGTFPEGDGTRGNDGWCVISGTSAAAPQLAGVCALLLQKNPGLTPQQVKQLLLTTGRDCSRGAANPASNEGTGMKAAAGVDGATGYGLVDVGKAVKLA